MNIIKQKQIQGYREQTNGYQQGERWRQEQNTGRRLEAQNNRYKINNIQGRNVQHREYNQYFIIIINGV